jgi:hypothetical protein
LSIFSNPQKKISTKSRRSPRRCGAHFLLINVRNIPASRSNSSINNPRHGGLDMDRVLADALAPGAGLPRRAVLAECRRAREALSSATETTLHLGGAIQVRD